MAKPGCPSETSCFLWQIWGFLISSCFFKGRGAPFLLSLGFLAWKMGMAKQSRSSHCPFHPQVYPLISCLPRKHCVDTERTSRFLQGGYHSPFLFLQCFWCSKPWAVLLCSALSPTRGSEALLGFLGYQGWLKGQAFTENIIPDQRPHGGYCHPYPATFLFRFIPYFILLMLLEMFL